jgi:acyl carrier protein
MDPATIRQAIADAVAAIAPEADLGRIDPRGSLREQLDLDSFDFLNLLIALRERLGVEIPEADYGRVDSLAHLVGELDRRLHGH